MLTKIAVNACGFSQVDYFGISFPSLEAGGLRIPEKKREKKKKPKTGARFDGVSPSNPSSGVLGLLLSLCFSSFSGCRRAKLSLCFRCLPLNAR